MFAFSIKQPWADALVGGHKSIEIRGWRPPRGAIGQVIAIHAGKDDDRYAPLLVVRLATGNPHVLHVARERRGGIVGTAHLVAAKRYTDMMTFAREECEHLNEAHWFAPGLWGWVFDQPARFDRLIPCRGQLGTFALPAEIEAQARRMIDGK